MTHNAPFKKYVRARMEDTGEPYSVAARHIRDEQLGNDFVFSVSGIQRRWVRNCPHILFDDSDDLTSFVSEVVEDLYVPIDVLRSINDIDTVREAHRWLEAAFYQNDKEARKVVFVVIHDLNALLNNPECDEKVQAELVDILRKGRSMNVYLVAYSDMSCEMIPALGLFSAADTYPLA